jgi:hypothetical protein
VTFIKIRSHRRKFSNSDSVEQKKVFCVPHMCVLFAALFQLEPSSFAFRTFFPPKERHNVGLLRFDDDHDHICYRFAQVRIFGGKSNEFKSLQFVSRKRKNFYKKFFLSMTSSHHQLPVFELHLAQKFYYCATALTLGRSAPPSLIFIVTSSLAFVSWVVGTTLLHNGLTVNVQIKLIIKFQLLKIFYKKKNLIVFMMINCLFES